jgi:hypothetical protein
MHGQRFDSPRTTVTYANHVEHSGSGGVHKAFPLCASHFDQGASASTSSLAAPGARCEEHNAPSAWHSPAPGSSRNALRFAGGESDGKGRRPPLDTHRPHLSGMSLPLQLLEFSDTREMKRVPDHFHIRAPGCFENGTTEQKLYWPGCASIRCQRRPSLDCRNAKGAQPCVVFCNDPPAERS